ncbi:cytochrome P450 [Chondromyces crocatus]|uniref:Cytochrome P450 n=1 Tax=Chondromyces crocatus TaxID=52 RepID=B1GYG3_CHOCO|nr:cytochrome P450 [Chondromyces crocatus]AKT41317.1 cytochrome P450 [Chondromyces crocatus]CAQ18836.1 putative cytochrome P450 [Chondromyces crocatus]
MKSSLPPGPRLPGFIQTSLYMSRPLHFLKRWSQQHGDTFTVHMTGSGDFVFITSPEDIRRVFTASIDVIYAGESNSLVRPFVGDSSVVVLDGEAHIRSRRQLLPPFQNERMQTYATIMRDVADASLDRWPVGRPFPLLSKMTEIAMELMLRNIFGLEDPREIATFLERFTSVLDEATSPMRVMASFAGLDLYKLLPFLHVSKLKRQLDDSIYELIARRRAAPRDPTRQDVLTLILESKHEDGQAMTDRELRDALVTLIAAGYETSAIGMTFAVERLLAEPWALAKVHEELDRVLGQETIVAEHLPALEYLDAAIKESLRLRPLVPLISRRTKAPFELSRHTLPAETMLIPALVLTHLREDLYPDPERFDPARFLGTKPDPYAWLPFGGGARRCLGMAFAMYEMRMVLATVLRRASLELASNRPVRMVNRHIMLAPSDGAPVVLKARRPKPQTKNSAAA